MQIGAFIQSKEMGMFSAHGAFLLFSEHLMANKKYTPEFVFETSWEVCNKVGGIYTVLSSKAKTVHDKLGDNLLFIGPDFPQAGDNPLFTEDKSLFAEWIGKARKDGLKVRVGKWNIPGNPNVALVDFTPYYNIKNDIYGAAWADFGVDSLHAYGDYDEASMFSYAAAKVAESFYRHRLQGNRRVVYHAHEWMTCMGALYLRKRVPEIATVFTTHATSIGRSIAGNGKPLYHYLWAYDGRQMAYELNMESKHSVERQCAHYADCFTTVSDITANECRELLDKPCDVVLPNGFDDTFVPKGTEFARKRKAARECILRVANALTGVSFRDDTMIVATSGRYEYRNKGIDVFLEAMYRSLYDSSTDRQILALIQVPAWTDGPRQDLAARLSMQSGAEYDTPLADSFVTHTLHEPDSDPVTGFLRSHGMKNDKESRVKVLFVPCYLDGNDGIFNFPYYDLLIGDDLAVYPSYYEPWGYTPLEAAAFHVPCVTTSLSGFGVWAEKENGGESRLGDGVEVVKRDDYNFSAVADAVAAAVTLYAGFSGKECETVRRNAARLSAKCQWRHFVKYYYEAYDKALHKAEARTQDTNKA